MTKFQVGKTYFYHSWSEDCKFVYQFTILARTAKTVTINHQGEVTRRGLYTYEGVEKFKPFGSYSMCTIVSADKMVEG